MTRRSAGTPSGGLAGSGIQGGNGPGGVSKTIPKIGGSDSSQTKTAVARPVGGDGMAVKGQAGRTVAPLSSESGNTEGSGGVPSGV
jgi:hypothetical protein